MRVLITGGAGFIGANWANRLLTEGHHVRVVDDLSAGDSQRLVGAPTPGGAQAGPGGHIGYSPYCVPRIIGGVKGVLVDESLREVELMAWDFAMNFARDNELVVVEQPPHE